MRAALPLKSADPLSIDEVNIAKTIPPGGGITTLIARPPKCPAPAGKAMPSPPRPDLRREG
jgi:hypothetical protein